MAWKTLSMDSDLYTYEYFVTKDVCRICLCQNGEKEVSFPASNVKETKFSAAENVLQFIGIDLTLNTLPTKLCYSCSNEVEKFSEFRSFCHETQRKLHDIYQQGQEGPQDSKNDILLKHDYESNDFAELDIANTFQNSETARSNIDISNSYEEGNFSDLELSNLFSLDEESKPKQKKTINVKKNTESAYYCTYKSCQFDLASPELFSKHNNNIHGIENGTYKCFGCDKTFKNRKRCLVHEFLSCKFLQNGYKCSICHSYVHKRSYFEKHLLAHEQNQDIPKIVDLFKCKKCRKVFKSVELLNGHMKCHGNEKEHWVCDTCGRIFLRRDYLYKHKLIHEGRKLHACTKCDFKTVQKSSLNVHMRKHTGERPFACTICPQRCVNNSNLQKHMKLHLGIKQFQCKLCEKKFSQKISLQEHIACIHDSCSEVHTCEDCGATYTRFRHLQRHLRTKHGKRISKSKMADGKAADEINVEFQGVVCSKE